MIDNFLSSINAVKNDAVSVNVEFVNAVKASLKPCSISIDVIVKNMDDMLGIKVTIRNAKQPTFDGEAGCDIAFLDALLCGMAGNTEPLANYNPNGKYVEKGSTFKQELFNKLFSTQLPVKAKYVTVKDGESGIYEVTFQVDYRRKLKLYFSSVETTVIDELREGGYLKDETPAA